jgi:hypothetical protein
MKKIARVLFLLCLFTIIAEFTCWAGEKPEIIISKLCFIKPGKYPLVEISLENCQFKGPNIITCAFLVNCLERSGYYLLANHEWHFFDNIGPKPQLPLYQFFFTPDHRVYVIIYLPSSGAVPYEQNKIISLKEASLLLGLN